MRLETEYSCHSEHVLLRRIGASGHGTYAAGRQCIQTQFHLSRQAFPCDSSSYISRPVIPCCRRAPEQCRAQLAVTFVTPEFSERRNTDESLRTSEETFRLIFDRHPHSMWVYDRETFQFLEVNNAAVTHYGYSRDEFLAMRITDIRPEEDVSRVRDGAKTMTDELRRSGNWRHRIRDGTIIDVEISSHTLEFCGRPAALVLVQDITDRIRADAALRESELRFRSVAQSATDSIVAANGAGEIIFWNKGAEATFGYAESDVMGTSLSRLMPERYRPFHERGLKHVRATGESRILGHPVELSGLRKDGREFPLELCLAAWETRNGTFFSGIMRDITERSQAAEALEHRAFYDPLTDLPNRTLLRDRLRQAILGAQRGNSLVALLLMDVDRFKEVNDTFGHHFGDMLLQQLGPRIQGCLREADTVARLGGDEFAMLLTGVDATRASQVATKILSSLERPFCLEGQLFSVEGSIGIACFPHQGEDGETLLQHADVAMYVAKRGGSGYAIYAPEHDEYSPKRLALIGDLRHGIEHGQLLLHYQPKLSLKTESVEGVEALVRWRHPEYGLIPPEQFIPLAEHTGLIRPLSLWVLREALRQGQVWHEEGLALHVAVNLSARNLHDVELIQTVSEILETWEVSPEWLQIELTESGIMTDLFRSVESLQRLQDLGVRISIDDFGTGYSSLAYLKRLPIDEIKIDRSFVKEVACDENDRHIVRATIGLGHDLGLRTVAEGVEDRIACDLVRSMGCDSAQGYYVSRPLPAVACTQWLREHQVASSTEHRRLG